MRAEIQPPLCFQARQNEMLKMQSPIFRFTILGRSAFFCAFINRAEKLRCGCERNIIFAFKILKKGEFSFFSFFVRNHNKKNYEKMRKPRRKRLTSTELCAIIFSEVGKTRLFFVLWLAVANRLCRPDGFRNTSGRIKGKTTGKITAKKKKSRDRT